jgi:hypothetical protein
VANSKKTSNANSAKRSDYVSVFSGDAGQRVLSDLMTTFHIGSSSHVSGDSHETSFREGERHAILHIMHKIGKRGDSSWVNDALDDGVVQYSTLEEFGL